MLLLVCISLFFPIVYTASVTLNVLHVYVVLSIPTSHLSMYARAMLIVENDNIVFNTKMSTFIVKGSKEVKRIVTLFPKATCSCLSTGECYHILAAKILAWEWQQIKKRFHVI